MRIICVRYEVTRRQVASIATAVTEDEKYILFYLAKKNQPKVAVEIGSYWGASSICINNALQRDSVLYCIDSWMNDGVGMRDPGHDSYAQFIENTKSCEHITPIRKMSYEAVNDVPEVIDYLFIDGDHSYEGIFQDVQNYFPKLKSGGVIIMHDIGWAEGIQKVAQENVIPFMEKHEIKGNIFYGYKK